MPGIVKDIKQFNSSLEMSQGKIRSLEASLSNCVETIQKKLKEKFAKEFINFKGITEEFRKRITTLEEKVKTPNKCRTAMIKHPRQASLLHSTWSLLPAKRDDHSI